MSNMSYVAFQNTAPDVRDCLEKLESEGVQELSDEELRAAKRLLEYARELVNVHADDIEAEHAERFAPKVVAKVAKASKRAAVREKL